MDIVPIDDRDAWDGALHDLANPHVLQTWDWGALKERHGWQATRLLFRESGYDVGAATVLRRRLPFPPVSVLYVPRGPLVNWRNPTRAARALGALEQFARRTRAIFVKVDPDVYYPDAAPAWTTRPAVAPAIARLLDVRGWRFSGDQIQFRNTVLLDLDRDEEALLAAMKSKGRYNVRLARRRGVQVRDGDRSELPLLYDLYADTAARAGFAIRPRGYYLDAWGTFLDAGRATFLLAEVEGDAVAGLVLFHFGTTAWYMYGASSTRHRECMPNNLLQWEATRRARALGCTLYDLWGAPDELDEADPMWGVYRFKLALGGEFARGLGAWDFVARPRLYRLYTEALPRYLSLLRHRK
jgi:lipid II:glycine glycyltransferase (peptidoglycan interpeptide bridge formation enzyme)